MLHNKKRDLTPFDMTRAPARQSAMLLPLIWGASYLMTRKNQLRLQKQDMQDIRPPFLVLSTHQGFSDYYIAPLALFPHRANYVSDMEGFAAFGGSLYRAIGCIGKRRYVAEPAVLRNLRKALRNGQSVVVFPESRHANVGTTTRLPENLGRLAKHLGVPLVVLTVHGSYLANPFWDEAHDRRVPITATLRCLYTAEALAKADADTVQHAIFEALQYDEYRWQLENRISISDPNRARGLHLPLYQCHSCGALHQMTGTGHTLSCAACDAVWEMDEFGSLCRGSEKLAIPAWYEWQRAQLEQSLTEQSAVEEFPVRVEALPNEKGFVPLGNGKLTLDSRAFRLEIGARTLEFPHAARESVQTEYNYRGRGSCIVLSDRDCCYYLYCAAPDFNPTRLQFAGEFYHRQKRQSLHKK